MSDEYTYRHPRTMQEAFGPHTSNQIDESDPRDWQDSPLLTLDMAIRWVHGFLAFVGVVALSAGIGLYHAGFFDWLFNLK